jgi:hypothetical protein
VSEAFVATVLRPLLVTAALPAAAAAAGAVASRLAPRRLGGPGWIVGLGLGVGLVAAQVLVAGRPALPPRDVVHWVPLAVAAAWLLGTVEGLRAWPRLLRWSAHALLLAGLGAALVRPLARRWEAGATLAWIVGVAAAGTVLWWLLDRPARRRPLPFALGPLAIAAAAFAGVMVLSGSAKSSQLLGALAAGVGALALAALLGRLESADGAPLAVGVVALVALRSSRWPPPQAVSVGCR